MGMSYRGQSIFSPEQTFFANRRQLTSELEKANLVQYVILVSNYYTIYSYIKKYKSNEETY